MRIIFLKSSEKLPEKAAAQACVAIYPDDSFPHTNLR